MAALYKFQEDDGWVVSATIHHSYIQLHCEIKSKSISIYPTLRPSNYIFIAFCLFTAFIATQEKVLGYFRITNFQMCTPVFSILKLKYKKCA